MLREDSTDSGKKLSLGRRPGKGFWKGVDSDQTDSESLRARLRSKPARSTPRPVKPSGNSRRSLRSTHAAVIGQQLERLREKDSYTAYHSIRVEIYAQRLAELLGLASEDIELIRIAAVLHDIGKLGIPESILTKPGPLTEEEFEIMKKHPAIGAEILEPLGLERHVVPFVLHHHEWFDGSGYPSGLSAVEIPFGSRIIQAADCIDAMFFPRSYQSGMMLEKVISELRDGSGVQFDPTVAAKAIRWLIDESDVVMRSQAMNRASNHRDGVLFPRSRPWKAVDSAASAVPVPSSTV